MLRPNLGSRGSPHPGTSAGMFQLSPTPGRQMLFAAASAASVPVLGLLTRPKSAYSLYTHISPVVASYYKIQSVLPALGRRKKLGIRVGTEPSTRTLGSMGPIIEAQYGPAYMARIPILYPDIGLMAVPNSSSRLIWESKKQSMSRGGEHTISSQKVAGPLVTRKSIRGPSALDPLDKKAYASRSRKRKTGPSSKRRPVGPPKGKATKKRSFSRRGRPTPWCYRHRRKHWCVYTR